MSPPPFSPDAPVLPVPRSPGADVDGIVRGGVWPPGPAAELCFDQRWRPEREPAFRPGRVRVAASPDALLIGAELEDDRIHTTATRDDDRLWERGDVFEIFLQPSGTEAYFEFQISPNGRRLQVFYPRVGAARLTGIEPFIRRKRRLDFAVLAEPTRAQWRIAARIPVKPLLPPGSDGTNWRMAFCRYDHAVVGPPCLSSTAPLSQLPFNRTEEWSRLTVPGGFSPPT